MAALVLRFLLLAACIGSGQAADPPVVTEQSYVLTQYSTLRTNHLAHRENTEFAWKFAEICFNRAEFATNDSERASIAMEGIAAARGILAKEPTNAPALLALGLNLGRLAQTRLLGALPLVKEMEQTFKASLEADEAFDYAAAHRSLGMLYHQAPGWPASIGSKSKARRHLEKAVEVAPNYPDNHLTLLEALADWKNRDELRLGIARYKRIVPSARRQFEGGRWAYDWMHWDERFRQVERRAKELGL
jgi:tetratricopeptide (TPR) repeat protein